jgi:hypothetical protein
MNKQAKNGKSLHEFNWDKIDKCVQRIILKRAEKAKKIQDERMYS